MYQVLMNPIFREFLRKFVIVFFVDIFIYSQSWEEHLLHLRMLFSILQDQQFFLKKSKYSFAQPTVSYLDHQVSREGVAVDNAKISAITKWPQPTSVRALRGFLGLTGYYRKFVKNYGFIAAPLLICCAKILLFGQPTPWTPLQNLS